MCKVCKYRNVCSCPKPTPVLEDWAKIKAFREELPASYVADGYILTNWRSMASCIRALARRIQRDDTPPPPPVPQDLLIWREACAKSAEKITNPRANPKDYRKGVMDHYYFSDGTMKTAIHLALEGFGKEVT